MSNQEPCCSPLAATPLDAVEAATFAPLFKALGDPVRLRLFSLIASHQGGEACVCDLTDAFDLSGPTISHHLKTLKQSGLVEAERRGTWIYYRIRPEILAQIGALTTVARPVS
ncbi:MAG: metalloregulator ArsR/SmtB family transcription factor [Nocardioides sp.]|nr:metalloregulator ArsR/SmtB family transcription factor [Nocardioides sp.]